MYIFLQIICSALTLAQGHSVPLLLKEAKREHRKIKQAA